MTSRRAALVVTLLAIVAFWYFSPLILDFGIDLPWPLPDLKPFKWLSDYGILIGGVLAVLIFYFVSKGRGEE